MAFSGNPTNEQLIYNYLRFTCGYSCAAACGIMANLYYESGFSSNNLQNTYEKKLGYTDSTYTAAVDSGKYTNFAKDSAGYGLCQWTYSTRKQGLLNYAKSKGVSIGDLTMQLEYFIKEITSGSFKTTINSIKNCSNDAAGAYKVAYDMCSNFERPANTKTVSAQRGDFAKNTIYPMYSGESSTSPTKEVTGADIVATARSLEGKPYSSTNKTPTNFTSDGFVQYCYSRHGISLPSTAAKMSVCGSNVIPSELAAGDILFFSGTSRSGKKEATYTAIATGNGKACIGCMGFSGFLEVKTFNYSVYDQWKDTYMGAVRIIGASSSTSSATAGLVSEDYVSDSPATTPVTSAATNLSLSSGDSYSSNYISALSKDNNSYSSITNLRTGEEFKFYLNDSVSENNPVAYSSPGSILGRSVPVLGYDNTGAKTVSVSLTLYAGTAYRPGLSATTVDPVGVLHSDIALLKSFIYPDYSTAIVIPPSPVLMSIEGTLKIRGVLQGVSVDYSRPLDEKGRAMVANVTITVTQVSEDPPGASDIKNQTTKSY